MWAEEGCSSVQGQQTAVQDLKGGPLEAGRQLRGLLTPLGLLRAQLLSQCLQVLIRPSCPPPWASGWMSFFKSALGVLFDDTLVYTHVWSLTT
jgi:hypothetical protein